MNLLKRIHELSETEKEIVLLHATGELSFREIGELFGRTGQELLSTVPNRNLKRSDCNEMQYYP